MQLYKFTGSILDDYGSHLQCHIHQLWLSPRIWSGAYSVHGLSHTAIFKLLQPSL